MRVTSVKALIYLASLVLTAASDAALGGEFKVVHYSQEDLKTIPKESDFIRAKSLSDVMSEKFTEVLVTMTQRQSGSNLGTRSFVDSSRQLSRSARMKKLSTMAVTPDELDNTPNQEMFFRTMSQQYRKALEINTRKRIPLIEKIRSGMKFNLDLTNPTQGLARSKETPVIKYGLVETEIIPSKNVVPIASLGTISDVHHEYISQAKVIYTIDKLSSETTRPVFSEMSEDEPLQHSSLWSRVPSSKISVKIDAADQEAVVSDQLSSGAIPGARFSLSQVDGFFATQFVAGGKASLHKSMTHQIKVPLYGEMSISRQYDYKLRATNTSAVNILGDAKLPRLNINYSHTERRAKGEWVLKKTRSELSLIAEPRQGWGSRHETTLGRPGDKLSLSFNKSF